MQQVRRKIHEQKGGVKMTKNVKLAVILPDIHHPNHSKECMQAVFQWMKAYGKKLSYLILLGDQMDMEAVSHWLDGKTRVLEGKRLLKAYRTFDKEILSPLEDMLSPGCRKVFFIGNHEHWTEDAIDKNPQGEGYWELEANLHLTQRGWKVIDFNKTYPLGKLVLCHGYYTNIYHARKMVDTFGKSVIYGHAHDLQEHTKVTPVNVKDVHKGKCIGCLCDLNPAYGKNRPNKWVHGFSVVYLMPHGFFNEYTVNIVNGRFVFNGVVYGKALS